MTRGPQAKRCTRCGGILKDRRRGTHKVCRSNAGRPVEDEAGEASKIKSFSLYPRQIRKLEDLSIQAQESQSAVVRRLIDEAEET